MPSPCPHGYDAYTETTTSPEEISACCHAPVSFWGDGSGLYCKCCYGSVINPEVVMAYGFSMEDR